MVNKSVIENWGIADELKDRNVKFIFDNKDIPIENMELVKYLDCYDRGTKFCIYDFDMDKPIFMMNFIISGTSYKRKDRIKLDTVCVIDKEIRNKGIATYYLNRLIEFGIENEVTRFSLYPNPKDNIFNEIDRSNILPKKKLGEFYINIFNKWSFEEQWILNEKGVDYSLEFKHKTYIESSEEILQRELWG